MATTICIFLLLGLPLLGVEATTTSHLLMATVEGQTLTSPNYPSQYDPDLSVSWLIYTNLTDKVIYLDVTDSFLEYRYNCAWDYVMVFDGEMRTGRHLGTFCGSSKPTYYSSGQQLYVYFKSDSSLQFRGFHMVYQAVVPPTNYLIVVAAAAGGLILIAFIGVIIYLVKKKNARGRMRGPLTRVNPVTSIFSPTPLPRPHCPSRAPWFTSSSLANYPSPPPMYTSPPPPPPLREPKPPPPYTAHPPPRYSSLGFASPSNQGEGQELTPLEVEPRGGQPRAPYGGYGTGALPSQSGAGPSTSDW